MQGDERIPSGNCIGDEIEVERELLIGRILRNVGYCR
jgi:hypothetical protein